jgi:hypothetical protein
VARSCRSASPAPRPETSIENVVRAVLIEPHCEHRRSGRVQRCACARGSDERAPFPVAAVPASALVGRLEPLGGPFATGASKRRIAIGRATKPGDVVRGGALRAGGTPRRAFSPRPNLRHRPCAPRARVASPCSHTTSSQLTMIRPIAPPSRPSPPRSSTSPASPSTQFDAPSSRYWTGSARTPRRRRSSP